jgi:hypothetical protein
VFSGARDRSPAVPGEVRAVRRIRASIGGGQHWHVFGVETEVEKVEVLTNSVRGRRLGNYDQPFREERKAHYDDKTAAVRRAQEAGSVDATLEPSFVVMSLISLVSWFVAAPQITDMVLGDLADGDLRARYRTHLTEMARRMLAPVDVG